MYDLEELRAEIADTIVWSSQQLADDEGPQAVLERALYRLAQAAGLPDPYEEGTL